MGILGKLKKSGHGTPEIRDFCIQAIRFEKFLENARSLLDLFADGREKLTGEYIFDRHYVVSLIDGVVDRLGMMVYDAGVLAPAKGESLYAAYDRQKRFARNLIGATVPTGAGADGTEDPEYRLLGDALRWFAGTAPTDNATVTDFMKQAFVAVLQDTASADVMKTAGLFERGNLQAADMEIYMIDLWKDALSLPSRRRAVADFNSIPLRHLLMEAHQKRAADAGAPGAPGRVPWVAAVGEYRLSLNRLGPGAGFRLETLASGHDASDFIFVCTDRSGLLEKILPSGFHVESTDRGWLAWSLNLPAKAIEASLVAIGHRLFDENGWQTQ
jgi:hypothetical protein